MLMNTPHVLHNFRRHLTLNNAVLLGALLLVISSVWNTVGTLQKNFILQQKVDRLTTEIKIAEIEAETLALQQQYYRSPEYLELTARSRLGKASEGETLIILPPLPEQTPEAEQIATLEEPSNFSKWMRFLFGQSLDE